MAFGKFINGRIDKVKILDAHRNIYFNNNEAIEKNSVRITFEGTVVPDYVVIGSLRIKVYVFIPH